MKILQDKVAIVTGASGNIGEAISIDFARNGANVIIHYFRNRERANHIVNRIKSFSSEALAICADVANDYQVKEMVNRTIKIFKKINILINNAGIIKDRTIQNMSEDEWDKVIAVNLKGVFNCTRAVIPYMKRQRYGKIVNISALAGQVGNFGQANYAASKGGIIGFTKSAARELSRFGVTINAVSPGLIDTEMIRHIPERTKQNIIARIPLGRLGRPTEVAQTVLFLSSQHADYITGQVVNVNGGLW